MEPLLKRRAARLLVNAMRLDGLTYEQVIGQLHADGVHMLGPIYLKLYHGYPVLACNPLHEAGHNHRYVVVVDGMRYNSYDRVYKAAYMADKLCQWLELSHEVKITDGPGGKIINRWVRDPRYIGVWIGGRI